MRLHLRSVRGLAVVAALVAASAHASAQALPGEEDLRARLGADVYERLTGLGEPAKRATLSAFLANQDAFRDYCAARAAAPSADPASDPALAARYDAAREGLKALFAAAGGAKNIENVHWLLKVGAIDRDLSAALAQIRNDMVRAVCEDMARVYGEVHRMDFSPATNLLNDIDQTFRAPDMLAERGVDGLRLRSTFIEIFQSRFGIDPNAMDVVSHPYEQRVPDWRQHADVHDFVVALRRGSALLAGNPEAYYLEGAFRMQVERRSYESDQELYSIFIANPTNPETGVARLAYVEQQRGLIRAHGYRFVPPETRRAYAWGSAVGNWWFAQEHGFGTRYAAKYGLRSFGEGPGWLVVHDRLEAQRPSERHLPVSYEEVVDLPTRAEYLDEVYDRFFAGFALSREEMRWTLERAKTVRDLKDQFNAHKVFGADALAAAGGDEAAFAADRVKLLDAQEARFASNMRRLMMRTIELGLPARLADWLHPQVDPIRLGFSREQVAADDPSMRAAVDAARKRLRVAALYEIVLGLKVLPAAERAAMLQRIAADTPELAVRPRRAGATLPYVLEAVSALAEQQAPRLLGHAGPVRHEGDAGEGAAAPAPDAPRPTSARRTVELPAGDGAIVTLATDDPLAEAAARQRSVERDMRRLADRLAAALDAEVRPLLAEDPALGTLPAEVRAALRDPVADLARRWDDAIAGARAALAEAEGQAAAAGTASVRFVRDAEARRQAIDHLTRQMWDAAGWELHRAEGAGEAWQWRGWPAMGAENAAAAQRLGEAAVRSAISWDNASALVNVVKAHRASGGDVEAVREALAAELAGRLPVAGDLIDLGAILAGETHPGMLAVKVTGYLYPSVGQILVVYDVVSGVFEIVYDLALEAEVARHLQGMVPNAAGAGEPPGTARGAFVPERPGFLWPVHQAMLAHRGQLERDLAGADSAEERAALRHLLETTYPPDVRGARRFVFAHFDPTLDRLLAEDPARWPRSRWTAIKLGADMPSILDDAPEARYDHLDLPRRTRAFFANWARDYLEGTGAFADLPDHRRAHASIELSRRYFCTEGADREPFEAMRDGLAAALTDAYVRTLEARLAGRTEPVAIDEGWTRARRSPHPAAIFVDGVVGATMRAVANPGEAVPDLPSILDPVPGASLPDKKAGFLAFFDAQLDDLLRARHERFGDVPPETWTDLKLGRGEGSLRAPAPEDAAARHPLLAAFFGSRLRAWWDEAVRAPAEGAGASAPATPVPGGAADPFAADVPEALWPEERRDELLARMTQELVRDYRAGMIAEMHRQHAEMERRLLEERLPAASAAAQLGAALFGDQVPGADPAAALLGLHSGDPRLFDGAGGDADFRSLLEGYVPASEVRIVGDGPLREGETIALRCEVRATGHFRRPFAVTWRVAPTGGAAAEPIPLDETERMHGVSAPLAASAGVGDPQATVIAEVHDASDPPQLVGRDARELALEIARPAASLAVEIRDVPRDGRREFQVTVAGWPAAALPVAAYAPLMQPGAAPSPWALIRVEWDGQVAIDACPAGERADPARLDWSPPLRARTLGATEVAVTVFAGPPGAPVMRRAFALPAPPPMSSGASDVASAEQARTKVDRLGGALQAAGWSESPAATYSQWIRAWDEWVGESLDAWGHRWLIENDRTVVEGAEAMLPFAARSHDEGVRAYDTRLLLKRLARVHLQLGDGAAADAALAGWEGHLRPADRRSEMASEKSSLYDPIAFSLLTAGDVTGAAAVRDRFRAATGQDLFDHVRSFDARVAEIERWRSFFPREAFAPAR